MNKAMSSASWRTFNSKIVNVHFKKFKDSSKSHKIIDCALRPSFKMELGVFIHPYSHMGGV